MKKIDRHLSVAPRLLLCLLLVPGCVTTEGHQRKKTDKKSTAVGASAPKALAEPSFVTRDRADKKKAADAAATAAAEAKTPAAKSAGPATATNSEAQKPLLLEAKPESKVCHTPSHSQLNLFSRTQLNELLGTMEEEKFRLGRKYSFSFVDSSLRDALNELSIESKIPIILDESVTGMISISVKRQSFLDSLEMLISTGPYDYKFMGSYFYIGSLDAKSESWRRLSETYQYKLKHASSSTVLKLINPLYKNAVLADDTLGIISIVAPKSILTEILRIIDGVDHSSQQVLLKVSIAEIDGKAHNELGRYLGNMGNGFGIANSLAPVAPAFHSAVLNKGTFTEFLTSLNLMNAQGKADIKAQPKIIVQDGQKATFKSLQKTLIQGTGSLYVNRLNFVETGIDMTITPNIVEDDTVALNIENAKSGDFDFDDSNVVNEHTVTTKVRVAPGDTLLIGGMLSKKKAKIVHKIPFLGDIPVLGWLFRSEDHKVQTKEVIFTISPEILCD